MTTNNKELPIEIKQRLNDWKKLWQQSIGAYYIFGVVGLLCSILAASLPDPYNRAGAVVAGLCFGLIGFFKPETRYYKFVRAWRILDAAILKYEYGFLDLEKLFSELERGESIISDFEQQQVKEGADNPPQVSQRSG